MSFQSIVNGRRTDDDGRRTKTDHKSSPCHYVLGELIKNKTVVVSGMYIAVYSFHALYISSHCD